MKIFLQILAHSFLLIGIIGIFVPLLPTTPFILLATYLYSKTNPRIHDFILSNKYLGPPVKDWQNNGVIGKKAKFISVAMILFVATFKIPKIQIDPTITMSIEFFLLGLILFILTRPSSKIKDN